MNRYRNVFRTLPDPMASLSGPFTFAVIGDFWTRYTGTLDNQAATARGRAGAGATAVDLDGRAAGPDHRRQHLRVAGVAGLLQGTRGTNDDDWFFTYFQPYRYLLNQVPVYPSIGNHDTGESEDHDDRQQLLDNLYLARTPRCRRRRRTGIDRSGTVLPISRRPPTSSSCVWTPRKRAS